MRPLLAGAGMAPTPPGMRRCWRRPGAGRTGCGRSRDARASAGTSRTGFWPMVSRWWMCRPSCRPACGCSPPARAARPTRRMRTRSRWPLPACKGCAQSLMTRSSRFCGSWLTGARSLGEDHTRMVCQLHQLLLELTPGGAKKALSAAQAKALLARVRPRDAAGKARRRVAAELISDLERIYQRKKAANKELNELLKATATTLAALHGIGPSGAARLLAEVADVTRFPGQGPLRVLERHRADRRLLRRPGPPPAVPGRATARSTACCTSWPSPSSATATVRAAPATTAKPPPARHPWKRCAPSNDGCPTSSTAR